MKTLTFLILFFVCAMSETQAQELGDFRWQYRILLLMDPNSSPLCTQQLQAMQGHNAGMQKRDLLLFVYRSGRLLDEKLRETPLNPEGVPNPTYEGVILIGKDGGVKLRKPYPVAPEAIFERIDGMPMRKAEIKDR